ncbi:hypothetical protein MAPG_06333 [Magnaporthiopsis poae ATCC 64411]|uniref:Velvet domain-containing protein n=1 Tax=Magnaporthiopsis poae (strain ATCC 64411 / 73-15) TaxID=644358 RepID=A0A0C4E1R3_MAGP6|nr:hypothetical protein MAPG_06333 [Magnaporthiopsis poae ATCC 64411]
MARPGSGWSHDPYAPRHGGYVQDQQQYSHAPQPPSERLPGPSSLFSSSQSHANAASPPPPPHASAAHQYPTSPPPGRDAHYNSNPRPAYYTADYTTPSPITQTPPLLPAPAPEQQPSHYYPLAPRRHPDARLSPTQSSTTSDRSDDIPPADGSRGHAAGHFFHPSSRGPAAFPQAPPAVVPNPGYHMHQEDNRNGATASNLMGKLVPQSYSANGRQQRSNGPPTPTLSHQKPQQPLSPAPHPIQTQLPSTQQQQQQPPNLSERQPIPPAYRNTPQQQYSSPQFRQKYSTSPPPMPNGYPTQMEQYPPMPVQHQQQHQQQHQNSMSPRQESVRMSIHSMLSVGGDGGGGGSGAASSASSVAEARVAGSSTRAGTASIASSPSTPSQKVPTMPPPAPMASEYRIQARSVGPKGIASSPSTSSQKAPVTTPSGPSAPDYPVQARQARPPSVAPAPSVASQKQKAPATVSPAPTPSEYRIQVRQQPIAARSCGFGERDRRVIDPPPIVQLFYNNPKATAEEVSARIKHPYSVVHCSIWDETGEQDNSAMPEDYRQQRRLMGTLVASPFVGLDEKGEEGCFFCFPDLSCRTPGNFRLKFSLVVISPRSMQLGSRAPILGTAMSEVFTAQGAGLPHQH